MFVHSSFLQAYLVTYDSLTLKMNMSTLQFQSAHSAGSTHWPTAVCALQVLLVTVPLVSNWVYVIWRWNCAGFTASFVGLLSASASLCCANPCKALCFSDMQPKVEICGFCVLLFQALMNTWKTKNLIHCRHKRADVVFFLTLLTVVLDSTGILTLSLFDSAVCLAVFRWMTLQFQYMTQTKKLHTIHLQSARCCEQLLDCPNSSWNILDKLQNKCNFLWLNELVSVCRQNWF